MSLTAQTNLNPNSEHKTGKLLVLHDEYMLSDHGHQQAPDTELFISNIAKTLTGNKGGKFLDYSTYYTTNTTVRGTVLEKALSSAPYTFMRDRSTPLDLNTLRTYEVVFVGGEPVDNQMLIDYIKLGGSVCVIAGTGHGGSESEAAGWNQLLAAFGLRLESSYNDITGVLPVTSPTHPLFAGVKALFQYWGQTVHLMPDSKASIVMTSDSKGLIGYAEFPLQVGEKLLPVIYENANFSGPCQSLDVGRYNAGTKFINDQISSVKVPPGFKVTLFQHGVELGRTKVLYADAASLSDFDNITSGIIVEALPIFYENDNYTGAFQPLDVGRYDHSELSFGHDRISSVKVPLGYKVTLYRDVNFQGPTKVLYSDSAALLDLDNHTSSIVIEALPRNDVNLLQGNGFYTTDGHGDIFLLKQDAGLPKTWSLVIPGNFGGNNFTDLLGYDRSSGEAEFYTNDGDGNSTLLKRHTGWRKTWTFIIPGNFGGSAYTDLLFYDPTTGEAEIYTTDGSGNISLLQKHTGWRKTWSLIVPGNFGGSEYTDLLFYDPTTGEAEIYTTDGSGNISLIQKHAGWRKTWSLIIPGNFGGNSFTDLLFYDPTTGDAEFYSTDGSGSITLLKTHAGWLKTWSMIVPGNFGSSEYTDLLFYDPTTGEAAFFTTDGHGNHSLLKRHTGWRKSWSSMTPGNFSTSKYTALFFYDPTSN